MKSEIVKKLTGKNPKDFEFAASHIVETQDILAFEQLVGQSDFLFDFIKRNVQERLLNAVNDRNYKNLLAFFKIHAPEYEDFVVNPLVRFADEDLTDEMLDFLENGTDEEKTYAAKYFASINDPLAIDALRKEAYSDFTPLALNAAVALSKLNDTQSYTNALEKLHSNDEFEKLSAVQFLVAYNNVEAVGEIFDAMKNSAMPENIAAEISYLKSFLELFDTEFQSDMFLALNYITNGLGEIVDLTQVFDFQLFEIIEKLLKIQKNQNDSKIASLLLNLKLKFEQLTENDEYLFDEDKNTKNEIYEIKKLLESPGENFWASQNELFVDELDKSSDFVIFALELAQELAAQGVLDKLKALLHSPNQTLILKTIEVIKSLNKLSEIDKDEVLKKITDENIKSIISALFE